MQTCAAICLDDFAGEGLFDVFLPEKIGWAGEEGEEDELQELESVNGKRFLDGVRFASCGGWSRGKGVEVWSYTFSIAADPLGEDVGGGGEAGCLKGCADQRRRHVVRGEG